MKILAVSICRKRRAERTKVQSREKGIIALKFVYYFIKDRAFLALAIISPDIPSSVIGVVIVFVTTPAFSCNISEPAIQFLSLFSICVQSVFVALQTLSGIAVLYLMFEKKVMHAVARRL